MLLQSAGLILFSYFLGSIPFGYIFGKAIKKIDIREHGSGNVGATNVFRVVGPVAGVAVLLLDALKGYFAVSLVSIFGFNEIVLLKVIIGISAMLGHTFTVFLKFKGGKGVATGCGAFLNIAPEAVVVSILVFLSVFLVTGYVSLGSIVASVTFPINCFFLKEENVVIILGAVGAIFVIFRHIENIKRITRGTENKTRLWTLKK